LPAGALAIAHARYASSAYPKKADRPGIPGRHPQKSTGKSDYSIASTCTRSDWYIGVYTREYVDRGAGRRSQVSGPRQGTTRCLRK